MVKFIDNKPAKTSKLQNDVLDWRAMPLVYCLQQLTISVFKAPLLFMELYLVSNISFAKTLFI